MGHFGTEDLPRPRVSFADAVSTCARRLPCIHIWDTGPPAHSGGPGLHAASSDLLEESHRDKIGTSMEKTFLNQIMINSW